jgi:hypothetical protein
VSYVFLCDCLLQAIQANDVVWRPNTRGGPVDYNRVLIRLGIGRKLLTFHGLNHRNGQIGRHQQQAAYPDQIRYSIDASLSAWRRGPDPTRKILSLWLTRNN